MQIPKSEQTFINISQGIKVQAKYNSNFQTIIPICIIKKTLFHKCYLNK
jgi:hypothetical protein